VLYFKILKLAKTLCFKVVDLQAILLVFQANLIKIKTITLETHKSSSIKTI